MSYIMIGFLMAIGWTWGQAVSKAVASMLLKAMRRSEWYQEALAREGLSVETDSDIKTVKNQIGFRIN